MKSRALIAAAMLLCVSTVTQAHGVGPARSELREQAQQARIASGIENGSLTAREAARLLHGQRQVDAAQAAVRADGVVTRPERRRLDRLQDREAARIALQRNDRQRRH